MYPVVISLTVRPMKTGLCLAKTESLGVSEMG